MREKSEEHTGPLPPSPDTSCTNRNADISTWPWRWQPLEARHFGYAVLQHIVNKRWGEFSGDERGQLGTLVYGILSEVGSVEGEPWQGGC